MAQQKPKSHAKTKSKRPRTTAKTVHILERRVMALDLFKQGGSYRQIAETLKQQPGISPKYGESQAYRDVQAELDRISTDLRETAKQVITKQIQQTRALIASLWTFATQGDLGSVDRVKSLMDYELRLVGAQQPADQSGASDQPQALDALPIREVVVHLHHRDDALLLPAQTGAIINAQPFRPEHG